MYRQKRYARICTEGSKPERDGISPSFAGARITVNERTLSSGKFYGGGGGLPQIRCA